MSLGLVATLLAAVLIGLALGGLGGGGSILTVPVLVYLAGVDPKPAIAMSLVVVGVTAAVALVPHARAGHVRWRTGLLFGSAGMAGAYAGGRLGSYLPGPVLMVAFGVMMLVTAVAMLRPSIRRVPAAVSAGSSAGSAGVDTSPVAAAGVEPAPLSPRRRPVLPILLEGAAVGLVTGLVGAGGGFLVVPVLVLLGGLSMPAAVGTSLLVIALKSGAALAGYLQATVIDWPLAIAVTALAVTGSLIGARLVRRVDAESLRRGFGWFVVVMGVAVLAGQLLG